jgi:hypothetical protein
MCARQTTTMDHIFGLCSNENSDNVGRVTMLLWCIWHNRNDKIWNDNIQMSSQIERQTFDAWNSYNYNFITRFVNLEKTSSMLGENQR